MMTISKVSMLLLVSCLLVVSVYPVKFVSQTNTDQQWVFEEGSNASLVCTNSPYTGIHTFTFDATPVSSCVGTICKTKENDQGGFSFEYDTNSGVFTWIINFVKMIYNGSVFGCEDGLDHAKYSATVQGKPLTFKVNNGQDGKWTFKEGSTVELVCTNYPYTGIHEFTLDSATVCSCTGSKCFTQYNDQGAFFFKNNTISGVFIWTINTVKMEYNGSLFGCRDGSKHVEYTFIVEGDSKQRHQPRSVFIVFFSVGISFISIICIITITLSEWKRRTLRNSCLTQFFNITREQTNMTETETVLNSPARPGEDKPRKQSNVTEQEMVWLSPARPDEEQKITLPRTSTKKNMKNCKVLV